MRTSPALIAIESAPAHAPQQVDDVLRKLVGLIETPARSAEDNTRSSNEGSPEEVLLDLDLDGYRYLLLRMPSIGRCRIRLSPRERKSSAWWPRAIPTK